MLVVSCAGALYPIQGTSAVIQSQQGLLASESPRALLYADVCCACHCYLHELSHGRCLG